MSHYCDRAPDAKVNVSISIESDFLNHILCLQEVSKDTEITEFCKFTIAGEYCTRPHKNLVYCIN